MLNIKMIKSVDSREVFDAVNSKFGIDIEGSFNEIYCPPSDGAVLFYLPYNNKELEEFNECEQYVVDILMNESNFDWGESCYIYFNY